MLVLSPTRELASQIADSFRAYGRHLRLSTDGGVRRRHRSASRSGRSRSGVDMLVATPGRLLDLVDRRSLTLRDVEILVLDEADQMLDLGFIHALKRIVKHAAEGAPDACSSRPPCRRRSRRSPTSFLRDPVQVAVTPVATTAERVEQSVMFVQTGRKQALLEHVLRDPTIERVLVFTRTKHGADKVVRGLEKAGIAGAAIHGNKSPAAARAGAGRLQGRRVPGAGRDRHRRARHRRRGRSHVINYDLPNVPETYVHRIGRTARAGATGIAISFCNDEEKAYLRDIEKLTRLKVPVMPLPEGLPAAAAPCRELRASRAATRSSRAACPRSSGPWPVAQCRSERRQGSPAPSQPWRQARKRSAGQRTGCRSAAASRARPEARARPASGTGPARSTGQARAALRGTPR